jgi:hypothetical protein
MVTVCIAKLVLCLLFFEIASGTVSRTQLEGEAALQVLFITALWCMLLLLARGWRLYRFRISRFEYFAIPGRFCVCSEC